MVELVSLSFFHGIFQHSTKKYSSIFPFHNIGAAGSGPIDSLRKIKMPLTAICTLSLWKFPYWSCRGDGGGHLQAINANVVVKPPYLELVSNSAQHACTS